MRKRMHFSAWDPSLFAETTAPVSGSLCACHQPPSFLSSQLFQFLLETKVVGATTGMGTTDLPAGHVPNQASPHENFLLTYLIPELKI